jgi:hypothetical protein
MQNVNSSFIAQIGYEPNTQTAIVTFKKGGVYTYKGVTAKLFRTWERAHSIGSFFARNIKPHYECVKVA